MTTNLKLSTLLIVTAFGAAACIESADSQDLDAAQTDSVQQALYGSYDDFFAAAQATLVFDQYDQDNNLATATVPLTGGGVLLVEMTPNPNQLAIVLNGGLSMAVSPNAITSAMGRATNGSIVSLSAISLGPHVADPNNATVCGDRRANARLPMQAGGDMLVGLANPLGKDSCKTNMKCALDSNNVCQNG